MRINTNMAAMSALKNLSKPRTQLEDALAQLSSGKRIPTAGYDAAGLAIATRMESETRSYDQALRNTADGIAMTRTAEGAQHQVSENLDRIRELSVQAANGTLSESDRQAIQQEVDGLTAEIDRIAESTEYNGRKLLDGSLDTVIQAGDGAEDQVRITARALDSASLEMDSLDLASPEGAGEAMAAADTAIDRVSTARAELGSTQNRLESTIRNLDASRENSAAARSRIMDVDLARAAAEVTKGEILAQSSISMIVRTSQLPAQALALLG